MKYSHSSKILRMAAIVAAFAVAIGWPGALSGQTFGGSGNKPVIGNQTTALGVVFYGSTSPTVSPTGANWRTVAHLHIDTVAQVQWSFLGTFWRAQGVVRRSSPPPATIASGSTTLDFRYAHWAADGDSTRYFYDLQESCWQPIGVYRTDSIPVNISATGSTGAVCYEFTPWLDTDTDSLFVYQSGTWIAVGSGSGTGSGVDTFYRAGDSLYIVAGLDTFPVSAIEPDSAVYATLTTLADTAAAIRGDFPVAGTGTVISVGLALPTSVFDISGSPVTSSGTLTATFDTQANNSVFAGPVSGGPSTPTFRVPGATDVAAWGGITGTGTTPRIPYFSSSTALTSTPAMQYTTMGGLVLKNTQEPVSSTFISTQTFGADTTNWTRGTGWTFNGVAAIATAASGALTYSPTVTITSGNAYLVTVTQGGYSAGTVTIALGNVTLALPQYNVSNFSVLLRPTSSSGGFRFTTSTYTGTLDNVSILQITPASVLSSVELSSSTSKLLETIVPNTTTLIQGGSRFVTGINNLLQGSGAGADLVSGTGNIAQGPNAGARNTIGYNTIAQGPSAGVNNTIGGNWIAQGSFAGWQNTIGGNWIAQGNSAGGGNRIGSRWIAQGNFAALFNIDGSNWISTGYESARRWSDGTDGANFTNSVYVGALIRAGGTSGTRTNENVFGYAAIGNGDNTVTLGNISIIRHHLSGVGSLRLTSGTTAQRPVGGAGDIRNNTTWVGIDYHNGTAWRRLLDLPDATPTAQHSPVFSSGAWTTGATGIYGGSGSIANNTAATLVANGFFRFVGANGTEVISMKDGTTAGLGSVALYSTRLAYIYGGDSTALWGARVQVKNPTTSLAGLLELHEARNNGTNSAKIQAPANLAADYTLTTPPDDGGDRDVLMTDGSGVTSWKTNPRAEINATATRHYTLTSSATNYTVDTLSSAFLTEFTYSAGVLTYIGTATRRFLINYSLSIATDDSVLLSAGIDKNGAGPLTSTRQAASIGTTTGYAATANISGSGIVGLATSDTVKIVIQSDGAGAPIASVRFASFTLTPID